MAHNINTYMGRQAAWHALGTVTGNYMSWDEIQRHGGFNFTPEKVRLSLDGRPVDAWGIVRSDTRAFLGAVGEAYTPIDHAQGFRMVDALMDTIDGAHYETAGVLGAGETVWGLADLKMSLNVGRNGDKSNMYLLFATSHNATMSFSYWLTATRVVCQNTLRVATRAGANFRVKHTRNAQTRIDDAHKALETLQADTKTIEEKLNFLAQRRMDKPSLMGVLDRLFPKSKDDNGKPQESVRRNNILIDVLTRYESNDGNAFPEQRGTAYNLLNAVTEYTDHYRSARGNARAESAMFGSGERLKSQALEVLLETANGLASVPVTQYIAADRKPLQPHVGLLDQVLANHVN